MDEGLSKEDTLNVALLDPLSDPDGIGDGELDGDIVVRLEIELDWLSEGLSVSDCDTDVERVDNSENDRRPVLLLETVGVNVLLLVFLINESVAVELEVVDIVAERVCVFVWLADLVTVVLAVWLLDTDVDADTVFVLIIVPVIRGLPDTDAVPLILFDIIELPVFVTLTLLVFDIYELRVCVTDPRIVLDDNEVPVYEDVSDTVDEPVCVIEIIGVLDINDEVEWTGVKPAVAVAVIDTAVLAECVRVGLIVLVEIADIVDVLELLIDEVIVGLPRIVNVSLGVTVIVNRALEVFVPLVVADSVRDTRTLSEFMGLDVSVLLGRLDTVNKEEELPVLLDVIVLVPLPLTVPVFEELLLEVAVDVVFMVLDTAVDTVCEAEPEEVLDCLVDALDVPLTVVVLDI